jgi:hypothetical protein
MKTAMFFAVATAMFLSSCSEKIYFTQSIRDQYKLTPEEMKGIQFYLSDEIVLRKGEVSENEKSTEDGKLIVQSGRSIDQITFKSDTKGGVEQVFDNKGVTVSFEEGAGNYLVFSSSRNRNGLYTLQAITWEDGRGKVNYGDAIWYAAKGSENAALMFKMKSIRKLRVNEKVAKGRSVR